MNVKTLFALLSFVALVVFVAYTSQRTVLWNEPNAQSPAYKTNDLFEQDMVAIGEVVGESKVSPVKVLSNQRIESFLYGSRAKKLFVRVSEKKRANEYLKKEKMVGNLDFFVMY